MSERSNYLLDLEFDGTMFYGWQQQPDHRTVQGVLLEQLQRLLGEDVVLTGAGRTDRGVHALHMPASYTCAQAVPESRLLKVLRDRLPDDIQLLAQRRVEPDFNARFSARRRTYRYLLALRNSAFTRNHAWFMNRPPDPEQLQELAQLFTGTHDFSACCKTSSLPESALCEVSFSSWCQDGGWLMYHVTANRFLHHMVRSMVGMMVAIARGELERETATEALSTGERQLLPEMAPPCGLYLAGVEYPEFTIGELYSS